MSILNRILFFGLLSLIVACEPDEPDEGIGEVEFLISAEINGTPIELKAGLENYFMHTSFEKDENDIFCFQGTLGSYENCASEDTPCYSALSIIFRDNKATSSSSSNILESLTPNTYFYREPAEKLHTGYTASFQANVWGQGSYLYEWDFGDNSTSSDINPTHQYDAQAGPWVDVCLKITDLSNGTSSTLCNEINLESICFPNFDYKVEDTASPQIVKFENFTFDPVGAQFPAWRKDPDTGFSSTNPYMLKGDPVVRVCMRDQGTICDNVKCYNIISDSNNQKTVVNFDYFYEKSHQLINNDFSEITIKWYDENGKEYSSDSFDQPEDSYFTVSEVHKYKNNTSGESTKRLQLEFRCTVFAPDNMNDKKVISNASGTFGVAHP